MLRDPDTETRPTMTGNYFPTAAVESLPKEDLLVILSLMHRMLDTRTRRRMRHIMTELIENHFCSRDEYKTGSIEPSKPAVEKNTCQLSPREMTVLSWMKEGKTNWEIARVLGLRERTVRFHVSSIFEKLDVTSRTQAVAKALVSGLIAS